MWYSNKFYWVAWSYIFIGPQMGHKYWRICSSILLNSAKIQIWGIEGTCIGECSRQIRHLQKRSCSVKDHCWLSSRIRYKQSYWKNWSKILGAWQQYMGNSRKILLKDSRIMRMLGRLSMKMLKGCFRMPTKIKMLMNHKSQNKT